MNSGNSSKNYYEVLEVSQTSSQAVIRAAYRALMQKYHPDKNANENDQREISKKALLIREAFDVLSDDSQRKKYDEELLNKNNKKEGNLTKEEKNSTNLAPIKSDEQVDKSASPTELNFVSYIFIGLILLILVAALASNNKNTSQNALQEPVAIEPTYNYLAPESPTEAEIKELEEKELKAKEARIINLFAQNIKVVMPPSEEGYSYCDRSIGVICNNSIVIPEISLFVYENDSEATINHIKANASLFIDRIKYDLARGRYTDFASVDGEAKLANFIRETINSVAIGNKYIADNQRKGVEKVLLPKSFKITNRKIN